MVCEATLINAMGSLMALRVDRHKPRRFDATKIFAAMCAEFSFGVKDNWTLWPSIKNHPMP